MLLPSVVLGTVLSREPSQLRAHTSLDGRPADAGDPSKGGGDSQVGNGFWKMGDVAAEQQALQEDGVAS